MRSKCALLCLALAACSRETHSDRSLLTSVAQIKQLTPKQAGLGLPARIQGILTYADGVSTRCFVQDSTGGIRVSLMPGQTPPITGWRVEVTGQVSSGGAAPALVEARISPIANGGLPKAVAVQAAQLQDSRFEYARVAVSGIVQSVSTERPGIVTLNIRSQGATLSATVPASWVVVNDYLTDADVVVSGVLSEALEGDPQSGFAALWISDANAIETVHPAKPPLQLPVRSVRALLRLDSHNLPAHRVRVRGTLHKSKSDGMEIVDNTGHLPAVLEQDSIENIWQPDLAGFLTQDHGRLVLSHVVPVSAGDSGDSHRGQAPHTVTTALELHEMPLAVAQRGYPVHLTAVVTYFDPYNHLLFVQDRTDGIFVQLHEKESLSPRAGDQIDIIGVTTIDFAPDVAKARIRILGHPGLPPPEQANFGNAAWGREDCRWIELHGTVQRVVQTRADTLLTLASGIRTFKAHVLAPAASLASLVDADVTLRGVCGALFNGRRQILGMQMFLPNAECIRVVRPPAPDPYSMPATPIANLMQFSRASLMGHRVRLRATITYASQSGPTWARDETGGVLITDHEPQTLAAGDLVDVVGFPKIDGFSPVVSAAQVARVSSGPSPSAPLVTAQEAAKGEFDGQLVSIEGKLIDRLQQPAEQVVSVDAGSMVFTAHLRGAHIDGLAPGMRLRLTGICSVETEQSQDLIVPSTFRLLLRSPADVKVLSRPPWLTADRVAPALAGAALLILAALAWASLLRRRVRAQTFALHAQTVQLQAAHQRTRDALRKACEAESLDEDSNRILELIARDEPVEMIADRIAEAVASHCEGAYCALLLDNPSGVRLCAVPAMPLTWIRALEQVDLRTLAFTPEIRPAREFSSGPGWVNFIDAQATARFKSFCAAPIQVDGSAAGAIAAFFRDDNGAHDSTGGQLGLWCNIAALALERRRLHDQLSYRAQHDGLTGLPNRALLYDRLQAEIGRAAGAGNLIGVLYVDLDGFKSINDEYGHDAGDAVLRETARRMGGLVRRGDTVARIGGDEFIVLLPSIGRREDAQTIAEKLKLLLAEPISSEGQRFSVSACVGTAVWPIDADQPDRLLQVADSQMYGQKRSQPRRRGGRIEIISAEQPRRKLV